MDKNKNLDAELDEIFSKIVTITEAPKLPKSSRVKTISKTGNNIEVNTKIYLSVPVDHQDLYEVFEIEDKDKRSSITVKGLKDSIEIGSWVKRNELGDLIRQNRDTIRFIIGDGVNGE